MENQVFERQHDLWKSIKPRRLLYIERIINLNADSWGRLYTDSEHIDLSSCRRLECLSWAKEDPYLSLASQARWYVTAHDEEINIIGKWTKGFILV